MYFEGLVSPEHPSKLELHHPTDTAPTRRRPRPNKKHFVADSRATLCRRNIGVFIKFREETNTGYAGYGVKGSLKYPEANHKWRKIKPFHVTRKKSWKRVVIFIAEYVLMQLAATSAARPWALCSYNEHPKHVESTPGLLT